MPGPAPLSSVTGLPVVAMVGGGQLARMTHQAAIALGQSLRVLSAGPEESAALVAADVRIGDHGDLGALRDLVDGATVLTFDHEHVPTEHLHALEQAGHRVAPGPAALVHAQDKLVLRAELEAAGEPQPAWARVDSVADVEAFARPDVPFEQLVDAIAPARSAARHPIFQVMLTLRDDVPTRARMGAGDAAVDARVAEIDVAVAEAIQACGGDMRAAIEGLIRAQWRMDEEREATVSAGYVRRRLRS